MGCNPPDHTLPLGDSSHFRCTVKNEALVPVRIIPEWDSGEGVSSSELPSKIDLEEQGFGGDSYEIRLDFTATKIGLTSGTLYFNETSESTPVYSLPLGILVESSTPTTSSKGVTPYLDPVYQKVVGLASWISQETGVNFAPQSVVALLIVGPLIVFTIARRTQSSLKTRRAEQESLEQQAASEEQRKAEAEENTQSESLSIEEMASDPNQPVKKPKRGVKGAEGRVLAPGMVEMMVGNIDMPHEPSDAFNVLTKSLGDSDIGGADWNDELAEINNDDETDFTVAAKHRTSKTNNRAQEIDSESETQTRINSKPQGKKRTKSSATKKAKARTQTQKQTQKRAHTQTQSKKQGEMKSSKSKVRSKIKSESIPSNTNQKASEKAKKKRGKKGGKVGHTRGPGIDLK
ncbi:MAG: hypothetical protein H8D82_01010 [Euryarchaeota archaeon]|nr:hypothetical protein [Euryarchaeota archaeon]